MDKEDHVSTFPFEKTIVDAFEFGGLTDDGRPRRQPPKPSTQQWLRQNFAADSLFGICKSPYLAARNSAVRDIVLPRVNDFEWAMFIDNDVTITHPGVEHFLAAGADVVSCTCKMRQRNAWATPDSFHTPFWRCRVEVLGTIPAPWFEYPYSPDGCEVLGCDCMHFRRKVLKAGFSIAHAGHCGHACTGSWC